MLDSVADDVIFLGPGQAPARRDAFLRRFSAAYEEARIDCISELQAVVVVGEVAYPQSRDTLTLTPRDGGEEMRFAGYRSTIYRKQPDSRWLMARDTHTSSLEAKLGV